jgi:hypothetical protein
MLMVAGVPKGTRNQRKKLPKFRRVQKEGIETRQ